MSSSNNDGNSFDTFICFPLVNELWDNCCIGCDKPGIGAADHDPYANSCSDCALICFPCALLADLLTVPCRCYNHCCSPICCFKETPNN